MQSLDNEIFILITTGDARKILLGLQRRGVDIKQIRHLFIIEHKRFIEELEKLHPKSSKPSETHSILANFISTFVRHEALSKGIHLDEIEHYWIVNEANSSLFESWFSSESYFESEEKLEVTAREVLKKATTILCVYNKEILFRAMQDEEDLIEQVSNIVGSHKRMYLMDETLVMGSQAMRILLLWIAAELKNRNQLTTAKDSITKLKN